MRKRLKTTALRHPPPSLPSSNIEPAVHQRLEVSVPRIFGLGRRITKLQEPARIARQELERLVLFVRPEVGLSRNARATKISKGSHRAEAYETLSLAFLTPEFTPQAILRMHQIGVGFR